MLRFERVPVTSLEWDEQLKNYPERTIFQTPAWLGFIAATQNAEPVVAALRSGSGTVGYFAGLTVRKFGIRILGSPFPGWTTSYMGACLSAQVSKAAAIEALASFAFKDLGCAHLEVMNRLLTTDDLNGLGFRHNLYTGYEIDLAASEDTIFRKMSSACRRCIRKAEKSGVTISEADDLEFANEYYAQLRDVFSRQSLVPSYSVERVRQLIKHIYPTGMLLLLRAHHPGGQCIATGIFPAMNHTMYFWGGASWRQDQHLRPNEAIQWYAMNYWRRRGIRLYDMGGGGEYKRKYGGSEISVPWFRKSKYPCISHFRNLAQSLMKRRQQLLGLLNRPTVQMFSTVSGGK